MKRYYIWKSPFPSDDGDVFHIGVWEHPHEAPGEDDPDFICNCASFEEAHQLSVELDLIREVTET